MSFPIPPRPDTGAVLSADRTVLEGRARSTWGWFEAVGVYLLAFLTAGFATFPIIATLGDTSVNGAIGRTEIVATIAADVLITAILVGWLARWHREWRSAMVLPPPRGSMWRHSLYGAIGGVILVPAVGLASTVLRSVFERLADRPVSAPEQIAPGLSANASVLLVLLAVVVAPISEELFYRGLLFRSVRDRHGFWAAALASAIPFGLVHYVAAPMVDVLLLQATMIFTGLGLAWIYERRGTVVACMVAHSAFNVIGVVTILAVAR